ncbi:transposase [Ruegeria sp. HKCCA0370]|uniref:transposase n=1 Tax=Ruegeria sp. HKCCA0370 TaxID=2682995 RepID=UPI0035301865
MRRVWSTKGRTSARGIHRRTDHSDDQRTRSLREDGDVYKHFGISQSTFHKYKSKYGGMELSDEKLRTLDSENRRLKKQLGRKFRPQFIKKTPVFEPHAPPKSIICHLN